LVSLSDQPRNGGLRILVEQIGILSKGNRPIAWLTEKQTWGIGFGKTLKQLRSSCHRVGVLRHRRNKAEQHDCGGDCGLG